MWIKSFFSCFLVVWNYRLQLYLNYAPRYFISSYDSFQRSLLFAWVYCSICHYSFCLALGTYQKWKRESYTLRFEIYRRKKIYILVDFKWLCYLYILMAISSPDFIWIIIPWHCRIFPGTGSFWVYFGTRWLFSWIINFSCKVLCT